MKNFKTKFRHLLTPVAVLTLVVVMAVAAPMASLMGALRVNAASVTGNDFTISNLPARYAEVGDPIAEPVFAHKALWHANQEMTVAAGATYKEVGQYEWRFYADADKKTLITTHTVWVTQPEYVITLPSVVPTVAPKDLDNGKLVLPLPEKLTADGEEIELGDDYQLTARATLGNRNLSDKVTVTVGDNVTIDLSDLTPDERVGTLQVTYILQNGTGRQLAAKVLTDIEIKNITKDKVTFSSNPSAPSVQSLSYCQEIALTAPTANSAKYEDTTFNVEATTKIIGVKFYNGSTQPSNWDKISTTNCASGSLDNDCVKIDGLKVTTKQLGWYKFLFHTDTLFGNNSENENETDGEYWSDAVHIKSDTRSPEFKFVEAYNFTDDINGNQLKGTDFSDIEDNYSDRYPFSTNSTEPETDAQKILVSDKSTLTLPAVFATDNSTASNKLKMTVTVAQVKNKSGQKVSDNTKAVYFNNSYHDNNYNPGATLKINFTENNPAEPSDNYIHLSASAGLYMITLSVEDSAPVYGNGDAVSSNSPRRMAKYLYFQLVDDNSVNLSSDTNSPTIDDFTVSDVYLWEGNTFDFAVPTYSDAHTATANIAMDYYLVNKGTKQIFRLDNDNITAGRMNVDLTDLMDATALSTFTGDTTDVSIYAVARNFTYLQYEWSDNFTVDYTDLTKFNWESSTLLTTGKYANGLSVRQVAFDMHSATSNVATGLTVKVDSGSDDATDFKAGKVVRIKQAEVSFAGETDGRLSIAVYQIKDGGRVAVNVVDNNETDANLNTNVAAVAFRRKTYTVRNWYFTPRNAGTYQVVVTAKENASNTILTNVQTVTVDHNEDLVPFNLAPQADNVTAPDTTLTVGTAGRVVVPNLGAAGATTPKYTAKNRQLYDAAGNAVGNYTITVKGVCDPDCLTGERFIPHQAGTYTFAIDYYLNSDPEHKLAKTVDYVVEVTGDNATSAIKLDSAYGDMKFTNEAGKEVNGIKNDAGAGTATSPRYAITLPQFMLANIGGNTDFVVDRDTLRENLEKIDGAADSDTYQYMYPAIAIPMPNLITGTTAEDVEILVQKSGYNDKLVSSQTKLSNGENSVIDKIGGYWVFRPEGKFKNNGANYLASADDTASAVYVVTYKTKSTSLTFNITIGDPIKGELTFEDGFLTYDNGKKNIDRGTTPVIDKDGDGKRLVTINWNKIKYVGNSALMSDLQRGPNAGDNETIEGDHSTEYLWAKVNVSVAYDGGTYISSSTVHDDRDEDTMTYQFNVSESGTYTVTVSLYNPYVNQYVTQSFDFTIDVTATNKNVNLSTVWGVILVILSVGLLAGVIFYFVKTARETRFLDNPKAPKAKKEKPTKPAKDQKEDVK